MSELNTLLRNLPKIDTLLADEDVAAAISIVGRDDVVEICRREVARAKSIAVNEGVVPKYEKILERVRAEVVVARSKFVGEVINGTGVMIHTNLGRSPLGEAIFDDLKQSLAGYCNLEIDILERRRGVRAEGVSRLLAQLCAAEDAVVVNNNAAALFLLLSTLAQEKEVIVSRGELVQIGGGFRIPDILRNSGAQLREVGTTNITTLSDYESAINENTAMILKVHQANFSMSGFVSAPTVAELKQAQLKGIPIVADLGSGNPVNRLEGRHVNEPTPADMMRDGADLVCFSTDKMLGAGQGGVVVGDAELIGRLKKHPIMRVVRVDKVTFRILQTVLSHHLSGRSAEVPLWGMAALTEKELKKRVDTFLAEYQLPAKQVYPIKCNATFGGGSAPGETIPSYGIAIPHSNPDAVARFFQRVEPPVVGTIKGQLFIIDFRCVFERELPVLGHHCQALLL